MDAKTEKLKKKSKRSTAREQNVLIVAAGKWVDAEGGAAIVGGGCGIMDIPGSPNTFYVCVKITGRRPASWQPLPPPPESGQ